MGTLDHDRSHQARHAWRQIAHLPPPRPSLSSPFLRAGLAALALFSSAAALLSCSPAPDEEASSAPTISFPIDVNSAPPEQLAQIPGVGLVLARRIVAARPFSEMSDLISVQGIGEQTLNKITPYLSLEPYSPPAPLPTPDFPDLTIPSP